MANLKPMKFDPLVRPITHWENTFGFPLFHRLSHELDAMFDRFGMERPSFESSATTWTPVMEMFERNDELLVKLEIPGLKKEEITIELTDSTLVVRGERKAEKEDKKDGIYTSERTYGSFYRMIALPEGAKYDLAKATLNNGVLEIAIPLAKVETKSRKLEIAEPVPATASIKAA